MKKVQISRMIKVKQVLCRVMQSVGTKLTRPPSSPAAHRWLPCDPHLDRTALGIERGTGGRCVGQALGLGGQHDNRVEAQRERRREERSRVARQ